MVKVMCDGDGDGGWRGGRDSRPWFSTGIGMALCGRFGNGGNEDRSMVERTDQLTRLGSRRRLA